MKRKLWDLKKLMLKNVPIEHLPICVMRKGKGEWEMILKIGEFDSGKILNSNSNPTIINNNNNNSGNWAFKLETANAPKLMHKTIYIHFKVLKAKFIIIMNYEIERCLIYLFLPFPNFSIV